MEQHNERGRILDRAKALINGVRTNGQGHDERDFDTIAQLWTVYLRASNTEIVITPREVAVMMALLKIARIASGTQPEDSYADGAAYLALAYDILKEDEDAETAQRIALAAHAEPARLKTLEELLREKTAE